MANATPQSLQDIRAELDAQVVARVLGKDVTRAQLTAAFEKVKPAGHWKNPIDATGVFTEEERAMVDEAVVFFTGSRCEWDELAIITSHGKPTGQTKCRVRADGYFLTIGA